LFKLLFNYLFLILFLWISIHFCYLLRAQAQDIPKALRPLIDSLVRQRADSLLIKKLDSARKSEKKSKMDEPKTFQSKFSAEGLMTSGNVNRTLFVARLEMSYNNRKSLKWSLNQRYAYGEQNSKLAEADYYVDGNLDIRHPQRIYYFTSASAETSNLRAINFRWTVTVGVAWRILHDKKYSLILSTGLSNESTDFYTGTDVYIGRNSSRLKGNYKFFNGKLIFSHTLYALPSVTDRNFRWNVVTSLELPINNFFTFKTTFENYYESLVAEGKKNNDTRWTFGLTIKNF